MSNDALVEEKDPKLLRFLYTGLFYVVLRILEIVMVVVAIVQGVCVLVGGVPQADLQRFSAQLSRYVGQVAAYITWTTDDKPYPFAEWPRSARPAPEEPLP